MTIRGASGFAPSELPVVRTADAITVPAADFGLTLQNLNFQIDHTLTFATTFSLRGSLVAVSRTGYYLILMNGNATANVIQGNTVVNVGPNSGYSIFEDVTTGATANVYDGNTFINAGTANSVIDISRSGATTSDVISNNTFVGPDAQDSSGMVYVTSGSGLVIRNNTFRDATNGYSAVYLLSATNFQVLDNVFALAGASGGAITVSPSSNGSASGTVRGNTISTGANGTGVSAVVLTPTFDLKVERNTFLDNKIGVYVLATTATAVVSRIDLGGGPLGGLGGNNFRGLTAAATATSGAVVVYASANATVSSQTVFANGNLFAGTNPETVLWDKGDAGTLADVVATVAPTGNAAFVQALYTRYLHRVGNLSNANDAGAWVNYLNTTGAVAATANAIIRSQEALGYVVDDLYRTILGRDADAYGRQYHVNLLANGWTVEQVQQGLYGGAEYKVRFPGDAAYVTSLFTTLLDRVPSASDLNAWLNVLPSLGRGGVAAGFINSTEARNRVVKGLFTDMLKRTTSTAPSASDVAAWVNTGYDVLSLRVLFAGSTEFYVIG